MLVHPQGVYHKMPPGTILADAFLDEHGWHLPKAEIPRIVETMREAEMILAIDNDTLVALSIWGEGDPATVVFVAVDFGSSQAVRLCELVRHVRGCCLEDARPEGYWFSVLCKPAPDMVQGQVKRHGKLTTVKPGK